MSTQPDASGKKLGMWLFLYTEIMLFGGLFVLYAVYFARYTSDFIEGGKELSRIFGVINTVILLISSFAVAAAITAIQKQQKKIVMAGLITSLICGLVFLINKYFEWSHKIHLGIFPNSEKLVDGPPGQNIFFGLYYVITGLHGVHIIIGMSLLFISLVFVRKGGVSHERFALLENSGLYWHLVDLIWIFIFPLFYLVVQGWRDPKEKTQSLHYFEYKTLFKILLVLLCFTGITVGASFINLGALNVWIALIIASIKGSLVLLFFMHMKYEGKVLVFSFLGTVFFLAIMISFIFWDVAFR